jgi:glycosyltransferase involved in cell wall biosynthesis
MISIVIPTLNAEKYLYQTLDSILCQGYTGYEVIIVDGMSKDNTFLVARRFADRMNIFFHQISPTGQVDAINYGFTKAHGDIFAFLNADDVYLPGCFTAVNEVFRQADTPSWAYGKGMVIDKDAKVTRSLITSFKSLFWWTRNYRMLTWLCYISQPATFWRREFAERVGFFNPAYKYCFDYEWWLRAFKISRPGFINENLACWRAHPGSLSVKHTQLQINQAFKVSQLYSSSWVDRVVQQLVWAGVSIAYKFVA